MDKLNATKGSANKVNAKGDNLVDEVQQQQFKVKGTPKQAKKLKAPRAPVRASVSAQAKQQNICPLIYQNNEPFKVFWSASVDKRKEHCMSCNRVINKTAERPFNICLEHRERWYYWDTLATGEKVQRKSEPTTSLTNKYYCLSVDCVYKRHPNFKPKKHLQVDAMIKLKPIHRKYIKEELGHVPKKIPTCNQQTGKPVQKNSTVSKKRKSSEKVGETSGLKKKVGGSLDAEIQSNQMLVCGSGRPDINLMGVDDAGPKRQASSTSVPISSHAETATAERAATPTEILMTTEHKDNLTVQFDTFVETLHADEVLNKLYSRGVLTTGMFEEIRAEKTPSNQAIGLMNILLKRPDSAYGHFKEALKETKQMHLNVLL